MASLEVKKKEGEEYTTMREVVMKKKIEGKALFKSIAVTPTEGNKGLMVMTFVTRRLGDKERNKNTAEAGEEYIRNQLVKDIIEEVGEEEARCIIANSIMGAQNQQLGNK